MNDFIATRNLDSLNEDEKRQHYINVCEYLGLDPRAGLLKFEQMDDGTGNGTKHLVLYATKGATDRLRDIHGISVIEITEKVLGGAITYTAKGQNKAGRIDIAVGAATLEGVHGKKIGDAFMAAQTRASRRLTLQMAGTGLLDESEIQISDGTVSLNETTKPLSTIGQPVVASTAAGADITPLALKTLPGAVKTPAIVPVAVAPAPVEEKRVPNPAAGLKPLRVEGITMAPDGVKQPTIKPAIVVPPVMTEAQPAGDSPATAPPQAATTAPEDAPKVRRRRRTKTEMEAARSAEGQSVQETANMPETANTDPQSASAAVIDPVIIKVGNRLAENAVALINKEVSQAIETARAVPAESLSESNPPEGQVVASFDAPASLAIGDLPNAEQMKNFVARLTVYRNEILPNQGKMIPSHGMGVNAKIRAFFKAACPGTEGLQNLTVPQWETVLGFMDLALKEQGAEKLVEVINYNVGATDEAKENTNETNS